MPFPRRTRCLGRVFPDAKLATTLFVYRKLSAERRTGSRFASYVHPGRFIEQSTSALWTDTNSIKVYDPENLTIVSCTQEDWDVMASLQASARRVLRTS